MREIFVEKFGGASVNSATSIKNVISILQLDEKSKSSSRFRNGQKPPIP